MAARDAEEMTDSRLPHIPALCPDCLARCNPTEQRIALIVRKLITEQPLNDQVWHMPARTPICQQEAQEQEEALWQKQRA
jgi:hypothetical protein